MGTYIKGLLLVLFFLPSISLALPNESLHKTTPIVFNVYGCSEKGEPELQAILLATDSDYMLGSPVSIFLDPRALKLFDPKQIRFTVVLDCNGRFVGVNVQ